MIGPTWFLITVIVIVVGLSILNILSNLGVSKEVFEEYLFPIVIIAVISTFITTCAG